MSLFCYPSFLGVSVYIYVCVCLACDLTRVPGAERVPGEETSLLPALLLPVQRRAARDPLRNQRSQKVELKPHSTVAPIKTTVEPHLGGHLFCKKEIGGKG